MHTHNTTPNKHPLDEATVGVLLKNHYLKSCQLTHLFDSIPLHLHEDHMRLRMPTHKQHSLTSLFLTHPWPQGRSWVVGPPGMGKTTLSRYLAYQWAKGRFGHTYDALFLMPLSVLPYTPITTAENSTDLLADLVSKHFSLDKTACLHAITQHRVLWILDDIDTLFIHEKNPPQWQPLLLALLGQANSIIMTRPMDYSLQGLINCGGDPFFQLEGLNHETITAVIDHYFQQKAQPETGQYLKQLVHKKTTLKAQARTPGCLEILCCVAARQPKALEQETHLYAALWNSLAPCQSMKPWLAELAWNTLLAHQKQTVHPLDHPKVIMKWDNGLNHHQKELLRLKLVQPLPDHTHHAWVLPGLLSYFAGQYVLDWHQGPYTHHPLNQAVLDDLQLLDFLSQHLEQNPHQHTYLYQYIQASNNPEQGIRYLASNAATLLVRCGLSLANQHWPDVQLPGADLSGADLSHTLLKGANLSKAHLAGTCMAGVDLTHANLWDATFGEYPQIPLQKKIGCMALLPHTPKNQSWIAVGQGPDILILDHHFGTTLGRLSGHTHDTTALAFSCDGQWLASGARDRTLRLWMQDTHEVFKACSTHKLHGNIRALAFTPDKPQLVFSDGQHLHLWSVGRTTPLWQGRIPKNPDTGMGQIVFSPHGQYLLCSVHKTIYVWQRHASKGFHLLSKLQGHQDRITCMAWAPNGQYLISGSEDQSIRLWSYSTHKDHFQGVPPHADFMQQHQDVVHSVAFSADSQWVAISSNRTLHLGHYHPSTGRFYSLMDQKPAHPVRWVAFTPQGHDLITTGDDPILSVCPLNQRIRTFNAPTATKKGHTDTIFCMAFSWDGRYLVTGSRDHTLRLWTRDKPSRIFKPTQILIGHTDQVLGVAFAPHELTLVSCAADHTLRLWSHNQHTGQFETTQVLKGHPGYVFDVAYTANGQAIASCGDDNRLLFWYQDPQSHRFITQPVIHTPENRCTYTLACAPNGQYLVSGNEDGRLRLWTWDDRWVPHGQPAESFHRWSIKCLACSPDARTIASGSYDHTIGIWSHDPLTHALKPKTQLTGHTSWVNSVVFAPDGKHLVSGSMDKTLRLWSIPDQRCLHVVHWDQGIHALSCSPIADKHAQTGWGFDWIMGDASGCISQWRMPPSMQTMTWQGLPVQRNQHQIWRGLWAQVTLHGTRMHQRTKRLLAQFRHETTLNLPVMTNKTGSEQLTAQSHAQPATVLPEGQTKGDAHTHESTLTGCS